MARGFCLLAVLVLVGCKPPATPTQAEATRVGVAVVTEGPAQPAIETNGIVVTRDELSLSFKVAGIIREINVAEGQSVKRGQRLASLELAEIDARLASARELSAQAERDLLRGTELRTDNLISAHDLEVLRTNAAVAAATLREVQFNRDYATIDAPDDGLILHKFAEERALVQAGEPILLMGPRSGGYIVRTGLADRDVVKLRIGDPATIRLDAWPGEVLQGKVIEIPGAADPANGLFRAEIALQPTKLRLVSGLVVRLRLTPASSKAGSLPYAPFAAVIEADGDRAAVFVASDGIARRRAVRVAFINSDGVAIADGLAAGETVVTDGALYLADGERIRVAERATPQ
jgi:multidrug efflux system membrane fusion protein